MDAALYVYVAILAVALVVGRTWFCRTRGKRVVSGRPWALLTYASFAAGAVVLGMSVHIFQRIYPIVKANPDIYGHLAPLLWAVLAAIVVGTLYVGLHARSLGRSIILYNIRRDEVGAAMVRALKELHVSFTHRLGTRCEAFVLDGHRITVHGGALASRVELSTRDTLASAVVEATIRELARLLQSRGEQILDRRGRQPAAC